MSTTAEDISAAPTEGRLPEASLDATDEIANLLTGGDESETEDDEGEETQAKASTLDDDEESNDEEEADEDGEETDLEAVADSDATWEGVLGIPETSLSFDEDGNIAGFKTKVNGEEEVVKAADLIAGYQNNKAATKKSQALSEEKKAFDVQRKQVAGLYRSKLESVEALSKHFEKQLISEYDNVDWNDLRTR
ncbi:unnamed protein product, partial [marine sediment metagenome]